MSSQDGGGSVDSELAALLDEELFGGKEAATCQQQPEEEEAQQLDDSTGAAQHGSQAAAKRARLGSADDDGTAEAAEQLQQNAGAPPAQQQQPAPGGGAVCPPHPGWWMDMCIRCGAVRAAPDIKQQAAVGVSSRSSSGRHGGQQAAAAAAAAAAAGLTRIKHLHHRQALEVSADEAARIASGSLQRLLAAKQLVLVLDLDHTLLNTVRDMDLVGAEREAAIQELQQQHQCMQQHQQQQQEAAAASTGNGSASSSDVCRPLPELYHFADKGLWTKLRPGVGPFLAALSKLYELHIYTMGDKGYAALMADVLDPQHKLFVGRVVSASDSTRAGVKDLDVLLADEAMVLILDDTEHVWEKHRANLIQVERYHFFAASARLFQPGASSPLEDGLDEPVLGGVLDNAAALLTRIHARVYGSEAAAEAATEAAAGAGTAAAAADPAPEQQQQQQPDQAEQQQQQPGLRRVVRPAKQQQDPAAAAAVSSGGSSAALSLPPHGDVRRCLEAERRSVLAGCSVVFSRCWPQQQAPAEHPLWQLVLRLGGACSLGFTPGVTTHVVVAPDKAEPGALPLTDKVCAAQNAGVPVVHPDWLVACKFAWKRLPEAAYSLTAYRGSTSMRLLGHHGQGAGGSRAAAAAATAAEQAAVMAGAGRVS